MAYLDIQLIQERVVQKMDDTEQNLFLSIKDNLGRIIFVYNLLKKYKMLPHYIKVKKTCEQSEKYRSQGNDEFKVSKDKRALKMYNKAITYAPLNSQQLYLAYSNRSAVNYSLKNYAECLKDIETVLSFDQCTAELRERLIRRKALCEKALEENSPVNVIDDQCREKFKLSYNPHKTIPFASDSLEISYSEEMGRGIVATRNIKPGDVLVLEEPYSSILLDDYYSEHCYGCLKRCDSMIPCDNCCYVMFCNEECKQKAYNDYHRIDCQLMPLLSAWQFSQIELPTLRAVIKAKCTHDSCESLRKVIIEAETVEDPLYRGYSVNKGAIIYNPHNYRAIYMLETHVQKRDIPTDIFPKAVTAAVFLHFLLEYTEFFKECGNTDNDNCFDNECVQLYGRLLLHHNMSTPLNLFNIGTENAYFGVGFFALHSMINHSCTPDTMRYMRGSTMALVAVKSVKKGQQIFINYGYHYGNWGLTSRQSFIKFQYMFTCKCKACVNKWPTENRLRCARKDPLIFPLSKYVPNKAEALKMLDSINTRITEVEEDAPCMELLYYQEAITECWQHFEKAAPWK